MNAHALKSILIDELSGSETKGVVDVPAEAKITILVKYGEDLVPLAKVRAVRFTDVFVNIIGETEQLFVDSDCQFIVKAEDALKRADARPGFH